MSFHYLTFHSIPISSLWKSPITFFNFYFFRYVLSIYTSYIILIIVGKIKVVWNYKRFLFYFKFFIVLLLQILIFLFILKDVFIKQYHISIYSIKAKINICFFIASFVFIIRNKTFTIILELIIALWIFSEIVNYRAFGFFLDGLSFKLIGNLNGFWLAIPQYIKWYDFILFLPTIIFAILYKSIPVNKKYSIHYFFINLFLIAVLNIISCYGLTKEHFYETHSECPSINDMIFNPISKNAVGMMCGADRNEYIDKFSVIHALMYSIREFVDFEYNNKKPEINNDDLLYIQSKLKSKDKTLTNSNIIIVLIESLEDWVVRPDIMPNLCDFIETNNVLYAHNVISQRKAGSSADGQFIINTGILPVNTGTVSFQYCYNKYPSISDIYNTTCGIFPHNLSVWNQKQMSDAYNIDSNYVVSEHDKEIFETVISKSKIHDYILTLTLSSHAPFDIWADSSNIQTPPNMPKLMRDYIKSINFMDKGLNLLLTEIKKDSIIRNTTLVITGDHNIFNEDQLNEFKNYVQTNNLDYNLKRNKCPLIIYSPYKVKKINIVDNVFQMDIYPTILDALDVDNYYWSGFGSSLYDSINYKNRNIDVKMIERISDYIIQTNYFTSLEKDSVKL